MRVADVEQRLHEVADAAVVDLSAAEMDRVLDLVLRWYVEERVDEVDDAADGDMLLFQWGTYDRAAGESFIVDLTRQLIARPGDVDDEEIWQLAVTASFPAVLGAGVAPGDQWCSTPGDAADLREFIRGSAALSAVASMGPVSFEVSFDRGD